MSETVLDENAIAVEKVSFSKSKEYTKIENKLKKLGFTDIQVKAAKTTDTSKDKLVKKVTVAGETKKKLENIILEKDVKIVIQYHDATEQIAKEEAEKAAKEAEEKAIEDFNNSHEAYVVEFTEYDIYYLINKVDKTVEMVDVYGEEIIPSGSASYIGDMDTRIEFTFVYGENDEYPMYAYHKYSGIDDTAIFAGVEDQIKNKASKVDAYTVPKKR